MELFLIYAEFQQKFAGFVMFRNNQKNFLQNNIAFKFFAKIAIG
jgi:hypothetical protein